jgi:hypothetical protein
LKFKISWKDNVPDLNSLFEEDQAQLVKITKSFENLINQTAAIELGDAIVDALHDSGDWIDDTFTE